MTDNEVNEFRNLKKKYDHFQHHLADRAISKHSHHEPDTYSSSSDDDLEEQDETKPTQGSNKHGRRKVAVSAEVYGQWNKKGAFVPRVVPKSEAVRAKLRKRLSQAFMFN